MFDVNYLKRKCNITEFDGRHLEISIPVLMMLSENYCNLVLNIEIEENGDYTVYTTDDMFEDSGYYPQRSYDTFVADKNNKSYGIKYEDGKFIKSVEKSSNPIWEIHYFVRFFLAFNDFVIANF